MDGGMLKTRNKSYKRKTIYHYFLKLCPKESKIMEKSCVVSTY